MKLFPKTLWVLLVYAVFCTVGCRQLKDNLRSDKGADFAASDTTSSPETAAPEAEEFKEKAQVGFATEEAFEAAEFEQDLIESPLGIGAGIGGRPFPNMEQSIDWWHNWSASGPDNPGHIGQFSGGPIPHELPEKYYWGPDNKEWAIPSDALVLPAEDYSHAGHLKAYCVNPYHDCYLNLDHCKYERDKLERPHEDACKDVYRFSTGKQLFPGCANEVNPQLKVMTNNGIDIYRPKSCSEKEIRHHVIPFLNTKVKGMKRGRVWNFLNEPDDWNQSWMTPEGAAQVYNYLYPRAKKVDPNIRFYCCGTHPGLSDSQKKQWLVKFFERLKFPVDGIHYHNYVNDPSWFATSEIIREMEGLYHDLNSQHVVQSVPALVAPKQVEYGLYKGMLNPGNLPIAVTEWSALARHPDPIVRRYNKCNPEQLTYRQAGFSCKEPVQQSCLNNLDNVIPDNLTKVMRPIKEWFFDKGRKEFNHIGIAWFIGVSDGYWPSRLMTRDNNNSTQIHCLGEEYLTYAEEFRRENPAILNTFGESRLTVTLPGNNWGEKHYNNAVLYDASNGLPLARLTDLATSKPNTYYFAGNGEWKDSYYRFHMTLEKFQQNLACHPNRVSNRFKVRFEFDNGSPYSLYSPEISISMPSIDSCHYNFIPLLASKAHLKLGNGEFDAGLQVQNTATDGARMTLYTIDENGLFRNCGQSRWVSAGASTNYLTTTHCNGGGNKPFAGAGVVASTRPIKSIVNLSNGFAGGQYQGSVGQIEIAASKLYFPLVKHKHIGRTTHFYVQNTSHAYSTINAAFNINGKHYSKTYKNIPPFGVLHIEPSEANVPAGNNNVGSLVLTSENKMSGVVLESGEGSKAIQASRGFAESEASDYVACPLYRKEHSKYKVTSGLQVQNVGSNSTSIEMYFESNMGKFGAYSASSLAPGASRTFYAPALSNPQLPDESVGSVFVKAANSDDKIIATVTERNNAGDIEMKSTYNCVSRGSKKLNIPLVKEHFLGNTSGISIQNVGDNASKISLTYKGRNGSLRLRSWSSIEPGQSIVSVYASGSQRDWEILSGSPADLNNEVGSVIVEADVEVVALVNEASDASADNPQNQDSKNYSVWN